MILTGVFYFCVLPVFRRCLRYFPPVVVGTMLLLVAINLAQVSGKLVAGHPAAGSTVDPLNLLLAFATIACTVAASRLLSGMLAQLAILLGLLGGALVAGLAGAFQPGHVSMSPVFALPTPFPFGWPHFDVVAAIPLMVFAVISMVEATGQTLAISDAVGRPVDQQRDVPRTIRADALTSLLGGMFGTSLIITSGENIGIVRATGVRSRFVTAMSGAVLVAFGLLVPVSSLISAIPEAVVGGTAGGVLHRRHHGHRHAAQGGPARPRQYVRGGRGAGRGPAADPGARHLWRPAGQRTHPGGQRRGHGCHYRGAAQLPVFHTGLRAAAAGPVARDDAAATH